MKIEYLQECIHLAKTLNFTQTSRAFYITQPVLSKHISAIEQELGIRLFVRSPHNVQLTEEGKEFIRDAKAVVKQYNGALDRISLLKSGAKRQLNVGYLMGVGFKLLPQVIRRFSYKNPQTALHFYSLEITEIQEALDNEIIDIGITTDESLFFFPPERYKKIELFADRLCAIMPKDHPFAGRQSVSLEDLRNEEMLTSMPSFLGDDYDGTNYGEDLFHDISYGVNEVMSFYLLMMTNMYVSIAYQHLENAFGEDLVFLPIDELDKAFSTFAVWRKDREQETTVAFADELVQECRILGLEES